MNKTYQTVLVMSTKSESVRSEALGWNIDSGAIANAEMRDDEKIPVGLIPGVKDWYAYPTVLHALAKGFKLLAPPKSYEIEAKTHTLAYEWYLVREDQSLITRDIIHDHRW